MYVDPPKLTLPVSMAREICSEINVALLVWSEAKLDWGTHPCADHHLKKKTDLNIVLIVLAYPMKYHKCPIKNQLVG